MSLLWPVAIGLGAILALAGSKKKGADLSPDLEPLEPLDPIEPVPTPPAGGGGFTTQPVTVARPPDTRSPGIPIQQPETTAPPIQVPDRQIELPAPVTDVADQVGEAIKRETGIELPPVDDLIPINPTLPDVIETPPVLTEPPADLPPPPPEFTTQPIPERPDVEPLEPLEPIEPIEPPEPSASPIDPRAELATDTFNMLTESREANPARPRVLDKELLKLFQAQEGLKPSGFYGMGSGLGFLKYGFVPVKPWDWSRAGKTKEQRRWRNEMLTMARQDPQRAEEWQAAAKNLG